MGSTTIKVPTALRDRIKSAARQRGETVAAYLERLQAEHERAEWFASIRRSYAAMSAEDRASYEAETAEWDSTVGDGLEDA